MLLATIYVRGALAEAVFMGLAPWVLWSADAAAAGNRRAAIGLALGLAAALWTQAGLALWLVAVVLGYILLVPHRPESAGGSSTDDEHPAQRRLSPTGLALIGWAGGLALGVLGLLPVVSQHGLGNATYVTFAEHLVYPFQLLLAGWGVGPRISGPDDTLTFSLGIVAFGLAVLGIVLFREGARRCASTDNDTITPTLQRTHALFALAVVLILVALSMTLAAFFWQGLPFLACTLTYPWQLLLLAGPWLAWLAGLGGCALLDLWPEEARTALDCPVLRWTPDHDAARGIRGAKPNDYQRAGARSARCYLRRQPDRPGERGTVGAPEPDGQVTLLARWQALRPIDQDYTVFFHAVGPDGSRWGQQDTMPLKTGKLPTSSWQPGQIIEDQYRLTVAADAPVSSDYRYLLGLYQWQTGERLTTVTDDKVVLTP